MPKKKPSISKLIVELKKDPDIKLAILYGSFASGKETEKSDIDIAIANDQPILPEKRVEIALKISSLAGREVDVVDLRQAHGVLLKEILTKGKILFKKDVQIYYKTLSRYLFQEADFKPLLDRILKTRRERFIHGTKGH